MTRPGKTARTAILEAIFEAAGCGPFDGGCLAYALALQRRIGGEIWVLTGENTDVADHAVVAQGGLLHDFDGAAPPARLIRRFERLEGVATGGLRAFQEGDLPDAPQDAGLIERLSAILADDGFGLTEPEPGPGL